MIRLLRRAVSAPPLPRPPLQHIIPRPTGRNYTCGACEVRGFGTHCWCCGEAVA